MTEAARFFKDVLEGVPTKEKYTKEQVLAYSEEAFKALIGEETAKEAEGCPWQEVIQLYHQLCPNFPAVRTVSESRKRAIKARFREGLTPEDFRALFTAASKSSFLAGKNKRNWTADFDFIIKASNYAKILDGSYGSDIGAAGKRKSSFDMQKNFESSWVLIHSEDEEEREGGNAN